MGGLRASGHNSGSGRNTSIVPFSIEITVFGPASQGFSPKGWKSSITPVLPTGLLTLVCIGSNQIYEHDRCLCAGVVGGHGLCRHRSLAAPAQSGRPSRAHDAQPGIRRPQRGRTGRFTDPRAPPPGCRLEPDTPPLGGGANVNDLLLFLALSNHCGVYFDFDAGCLRLDVKFPANPLARVGFCFWFKVFGFK
jgi:hypothetical protein